MSANVNLIESFAVVIIRPIPIPPAVAEAGVVPVGGGAGATFFHFHFQRAGQRRGLPALVDGINALAHLGFVDAVEHRRFLGDQILLVGLDQRLFKAVPAVGVSGLR